MAHCAKIRRDKQPPRIRAMPPRDDPTGKLGEARLQRALQTDVSVEPVYWRKPFGLLRELNEEMDRACAINFSLLFTRANVRLIK
jgi:hypothetical protein